VAIKILNTSRVKQKRSERLALMHEIKIHQTLQNCEGVLGLIEIFRRSSKYLLSLKNTEEGGSLTDHLKIEILSEE
jgi:serine/threonine protein kinase